MLYPLVWSHASHALNVPLSVIMPSRVSPIAIWGKLAKSGKFKTIEGLLIHDR